MSNVSSLRYFASIVSILCCLMLPWSVQWVPNEPNITIFGLPPGLLNSIQASSSSSKIETLPNNIPRQAQNRHVFLLYNEDKRDNLREVYQYYQKPQQEPYLELTVSGDINPYPSTSTSSSPNYDAAPLKKLDYKPCQKTNSTMSSSMPLTYYFFELHIWLFYLSILSCSCFIQLYFHFKLIMMVLSVCIYLMALSFNKIYECLHESMDFGWSLPFLKAELLIQMVFFIGFLHLIDRRVMKNES